MKLGDIKIHRGIDEFPLGCIQRLDRLQNLDQQPLPLANAVEIPVVRTASRLNSRLSDGNAVLPGVYASLCFGHFSGDLIHHLNFSEARLLHTGRGGIAGGLLTESQIANLPDRDGIEVGAVVEIGHRVAHTTTETAVGRPQQHTGDESPRRFAFRAWRVGSAVIDSWPPSHNQRPYQVVVATPIKKSIVEWDEYVGRFDAVDFVEVRSRVSGYLQSVHFEEGQIVKEGDLLCVVDPWPFVAELNRAKALTQRWPMQIYRVQIHIF